MNHPIQLPAPPLLGIYLLESRYQVLNLLRMPGFVIPTFSFPLLFYVFFAVVLNMDPHLPAYLLATYGTFAIMAPALFGFGVSVAMERSQGWLRLKQASAMPPSAYLVAKLVTSVLFAAAVLLALFTLGATLGGVRLAHNQWAGLFALLSVGTIPFCALGLWIGSAVKGQSAPGVVNLIFLPLSLLSGLWVPIQFFPKVMQGFAQLLPPYHLAQLGLGIIGLAQDQRVWLHITYLVIFTLLTLFLALRAFYRQGAE